MAHLNSFLIFALFAALAFFMANASQSNRQEFCVGTDDPNVFVDGRFCKNLENVTVNDFIFKGLNIPTITNNRLYFNLTRVNAVLLPGLNTLGISLARMDFAPFGFIPPHIHPRGTEIFFVMTGRFYCGFVSSILSQSIIQNRRFAKVLYPEDVMVFPQGLISFRFNLANTPGLAFGFLSSEDFGTIDIPSAVFGAQPSILPDVLAKSFQLNLTTVKDLQTRFAKGLLNFNNLSF